MNHQQQSRVTIPICFSTLRLGSSVYTLYARDNLIPLITVTTMRNALGLPPLPTTAQGGVLRRDVNGGLIEAMTTYVNALVWFVNRPYFPFVERDTLDLDYYAPANRVVLTKDNIMLGCLGQAYVYGSYRNLPPRNWSALAMFFNVQYVPGPFDDPWVVPDSLVDSINVKLNEPLPDLPQVS